VPQALLPYQEHGAAYVASRERCGLHDEMGVGKTCQIIRASDMMMARRGIVICPGIVRSHWLNEFNKFSYLRPRVCKGMDIHDFLAWQRGRFNILVTSYEMATKWAPAVIESREDLDYVVLDEGQMVKNVSSNRSKAILGKEYDGIGGIIERAGHVWDVTGTRIPNDPLDVYTFLKMCRAIDGMTANQFTRHFFKPMKSTFGMRTSIIPERLLELQALIDNNRIRRLEKDVEPERPPVFLTETTVDGDTKAIIDLFKDHPGLATNIEVALEAGGLSFIDAQSIMELRRLIGEAKAIPYSHMLYEEFMGGAKKRVTFGWHVKCLEVVRDFLWSKGIGCVLINGTVTDKQREANKNAFINDPACMSYLVNMKVGGAGLDGLQHAACDVDLLEIDWSPGNNAQAIKRVARKGQTRIVRGRFITLARSFDETVNRIVARKTANIANVEGHAMMAAPLDAIAQFM
jgi:SWI/SNF-related matrix-associated actin-dependent regulator of chromatin subfamily A-like protein 1